MFSRRILVGLALWAIVPAGPPPALTVAVAARAIQPGELVVLTVTTDAPVKALRVRAFDRAFAPFPVDARSWKVLVGIDLDVKPGAHVVTLVTDGPSGETTHPLVVVDRAFPTRRLTVDPAFVNPPPEAVARIQRDQQELARVWSATRPEPLWAPGFVRPVPDESNSAFGSRSIFNGEARSPHGGADFLSPAGRPVQAPGGGRVALAEDQYYTGNTVIVDHGLGLFSLMAHLSAISVRTGDTVKAGDVLGQVGATGRVTGPHLHWTVRLNGTRIDPLALLALLGK